MLLVGKKPYDSLDTSAGILNALVRQGWPCGWPCRRVVGLTLVRQAGALQDAKYSAIIKLPFIRQKAVRQSRYGVGILRVQGWPCPCRGNFIVQAVPAAGLALL